MTPSQIITADCQQHGVDPAKVLTYVAKEIHDRKGSLMSAGNSILFLVNIGDHEVELHLFTQETPMQLMRSLPHFIEVIRSTPIKRVYGKADNPGIVQMLIRLGVHVEHSDKPKYNWMAKV